MILQYLVNTSADSVAIVFDRYFTPLIKYCEHTLRGNMSDKDSYIAAPQQSRTSERFKKHYV